MNGKFLEHIHELSERVAEAPSVRNAALSGSAVPPAAQTLTDKVRRHAYKVTDRDIEDLRAAGWSDDEVFELTVATAMNAGLSRLKSACRVLEEAKD
jgi:alkylhydroperoxidase family enzyme